MVTQPPEWHFQSVFIKLPTIPIEFLNENVNKRLPYIDFIVIESYDAYMKPEKF